MACKYTLEWLDSLIYDSLNPAKPKSETDVITPKKIQEILIRIEKEKTKASALLKRRSIPFTRKGKN